MKITKRQLKRIIREALLFESADQVIESGWEKAGPLGNKTKTWSLGDEDLVVVTVRGHKKSPYYGTPAGWTLELWTNKDTGLHQGESWFYSTDGRIMQFADLPTYKNYFHASEEDAISNTDDFIARVKKAHPDALTTPGPKVDMTGHDWVHDGYV